LLTRPRHVETNRIRRKGHAKKLK